MLSWDDKDPQEVLPNQLNWVPRLAAGDELVFSDWAITNEDDDGELLIQESVFSTTAATVWLAAGTVGIRYHLTNTVQTQQGWTMEQTVRLRITQK